MSGANKGYYMVVIARIATMTESLARYLRESTELLARHGGEYLVRGRPRAALDGNWSDDRLIVVSRRSFLETLRTFWNGEEHQQTIKPLRAGKGEYDVTAFRGTS
jgi:uncharacterized protein (DUF1330 family)